MRGQEYDDFVEAFVTAVQKRWPHILLQWEDFAGTNAARLLDRYRDRLCTFNIELLLCKPRCTSYAYVTLAFTGMPSFPHEVACFQESN